MKLHHLLFCTLLMLAHNALAETERYNRVDFGSEAAREVPNDLMIATLSIEVNDKQPARIAQQINTTLNAALKKAVAFSAVKASSGNQNTYPVYGKNNHLEGWRGHAELRLESRDFKAMGELIAQLQEQMQLAGIQFIVAPDTRRQAENTLITEAIAAFKKRADAVREAMGGAGYKIVHLSINHGGYPVMPMLGRSAMADAMVPAPQFAGGESQMSVQVSGTIEITP